MNEEPETTKPEPGIPKGSLWSALLIPPLATVTGTFIVGWLRQGDIYDVIFYLWVPFVVFFVILGGGGYFNELVGVRYKGRSKTLLGFFYSIGQIIICLALWLGGCSLLMR